MTAMPEKATAPHRYTCGEFFGREPPDIGPYISVPKALLDTKDLVYRTLSADAILLYSLLLDLVSLSQKSGWLDEAGRVYIRYPVNKLAEKLHCGRDKVLRLLTELEMHDLLLRQKQGRGKANLLFLRRY